MHGITASNGIKNVKQELVTVFHFGVTDASEV